MDMHKKIFLSSPHMSDEGYEKQYIDEAFSTNWIAPLGENVDGFEKELAAKVGAAGSVVLSSGTAAIHMALKCCGVGPGDYVFCSDLTFAASCNPIIYQGASPVFIDSEYETWNMCPEALRIAFELYIPKALIVVNLYGQSAKFGEILDICSKHHVPVIEDAAESLGATYQGQSSGTFGRFGVYSFNGNKIITSSGGGALVSEDLDALQKIRFWSTQARDCARHYQHSELGYNYRMSNVIAGIGRGQLKVLEQRVQRKHEIYDYYNQAFSDITSLSMMPIHKAGKPNCWLSAITLSKEAPITPLDIMTTLEKENVESRPVWKPMHLQPFYKDKPFITAFKTGNVSQDLFERGVCMPSDTKMSNDDLAYVVDIIRSLYTK